MPDRNDGHCHDPATGCFNDDGAPVDVCSCECPRCVATRERLLEEQGEGDVDFIEKRIVSGGGAVNLDLATTYAAERSNLTNRVWNARLIRRTLCFSKNFDRHCASIALMFVYRAFCHLQRNMKDRTAAMAADITDHVWSLDELMTAALAEPEGEKPEPKPLTVPKPADTARALPGDRGWLRAVEGGKGAPSPGAPSPAPAAPPAVEVPTVVGGAAPVLAAAPVVVAAPVPAPEPVPVAPTPGPVDEALLAPASAPSATDVPAPARPRRPRPVNPAQLSLFDQPPKK